MNKKVLLITLIALVALLAIAGVLYVPLKQYFAGSDLRR